MPVTDFTTNRGYPYPTGADFIPEGPAELEAIAAAVDMENRGEIDFLQAGVVKSTDWSGLFIMESSSECKLASESTLGGTCWLPSSTIGLVRSVTTPAKAKALKPSSLPTNGKYMTVGIELTPSISGGAATVSVKSGIEEAGPKAAEENPPAVTAGKTRIRNIVILNTAGVYSIVSQVDVRPWAATGAWLPLVPSGVKLTESTSGVPPLAVRSENGGATARLRGAVTVKAGQELKANEAITVLPPAMRPALDDTFLASRTVGSIVIVEVEAGGALVSQENILEGRTLLLSGCTFALR